MLLMLTVTVGLGAVFSEPLNDPPNTNIMRKIDARKPLKPV